MSKIIWDNIGERLYETGVKNVVLYVTNLLGEYLNGVGWNGVTAISESPSGAEATALYADDGKYLNLVSAEEFGASLEAYTYPDEFGVCDGSAEIATGIKVGQQTRKTFGICYRTTLGNDASGNDFGYKLHLIYGCLAAPSEKAYATINESPEAITFSWALSTTPGPVTGMKPTATITLDSTKVDAGNLAILEDILYGTVGAAPRMPLPAEIATLFGAVAPSAMALSSIVPNDDAMNIAVNANIVITFNNKVAAESIIVTDDVGAIVAGAKTYDVTGKILTFNPTANFANDTMYLVSIGGVVDIYGQSLAAVVKNFSTVA